MKLAKMITSLAFAKGAISAPVLKSRDTCASNDLGIPSGGMKSYSGIPFGFLPDDTSPYADTMIHINGDTGKMASTYGRYAQIHSTTWDSSQLTNAGTINDVIASKAVFIPAVMPEIPFSQISPAVASQIASVMKQFTDQGVKVWLRFAHEMNCYVSTSCSGQNPAPYSGTPAQFIAAWQNVHAAVTDNPNVLMFWSPNYDTNANLYQWWPGANYVDIVGLDVYPEQGSTFASTYGNFYAGFATYYNKHFVIGETGSQEYTVAAKEAWLKELVSGDYSNYPCYASVTWFEFDKNKDDFRIIEGQSSSTVTETLSNFQ